MKQQCDANLFTGKCNAIELLSVREFHDVSKDYILYETPKLLPHDI